MLPGFPLSSEGKAPYRRRHLRCRLNGPGRTQHLRGRSGRSTGKGDDPWLRDCPPEAWESDIVTWLVVDLGKIFRSFC
jgi:hypothetical protein